MKTTDYLDAIKNRYDLPSDYAIAKMLGIARQRMTAYRAGSESFSDSTALRVAELLDLDPLEVALSAHAQRAKAPEERALWERALARLAPAARHTPPSSNAGTICIM